MALPIIPIIAAVGAVAQVVVGASNAAKQCGNAKNAVQNYNANKNKK